MFKNILFTSSIAGTLALSSAAMAAPQTVALDVPGMTCATCPITVKKALMKVDGVRDVKIDYGKKEALVTFDDSKASVGKLTLATTNSGYPSTIKAEK